MAAADGQTLDQQSKETRDDYYAVYGDNAASQWESDHNAAIGANNGGNSGNNGGGNDNGGNGGSGGNNNGGNGGSSLTNPQNDANALNAANLAAQIAYNKAKLKQDAQQFKVTSALDKEKERLAEATQAWVKTYQSALLTGTIDGQPTTAWLQTQAELTGYFNGAPTLERDKANADNIFRTAQLLASLRGPKNAFQMANVITNGGLQGVLNSASGKYGLPTFGGGNGQPQAVTLQSFLGDAANGVTGAEGLSSPYIPGQTQTQVGSPAAGPGQYGYGSGNAGTTPNDYFPPLVSSPPVVPGSVPPVTPVPVTPLSTPVPPVTRPPVTTPTDTGTSTYVWNPNTGQYEYRDPSMAGKHVNQGHAAVYGQNNLAPTPDVTTQAAPPLLVDQPQTSTVNTALGAISYSPPGITAPANQYNYQGSPDGNSYVYPPGAEAPAQASQLSSSTPQDPNALHQATGGGLYGYGSSPATNQPVTAAASGAPIPTDASVTPPGDNGQLQPYQLNARTIKGLNPYNKDLLWAYYESLGWDPAAAEAEFNASLPQYGGPQFGKVVGVV